MGVSVKKGSLVYFDGIKKAGHARLFMKITDFTD